MAAADYLFWEIYRSAPTSEGGPGGRLNEGKPREPRDRDEIRWEGVSRKKQDGALGAALTRQEVFDRDPHGR